ncbi:DUF2249 domain-containing protein [uncultured Cytophaga sp.]|uniref:DUF2249 domain-containing protein n=1 Tax=uncultured Cytophaga sp. TaxID=160238 RepID=UPI002608C900|nr:DUF2249 domain-containing protein [uncultured Cytophaga sp.]
MVINSKTKISVILKHHPDALDAIVQISPTFEKLRNPFLRKIMAGRTSIEAASKIGKCSIEDFFNELEPLGFEIERNKMTAVNVKSKVPDFVLNATEKNCVTLDVRPILTSGDDPLAIIMSHIKQIEINHILKIINTFEPTPLIKLLEKKGVESYTNQLDENTTETYLLKKTGLSESNTITPTKKSNDWDILMAKYESNMHCIDVRNLEMPQPMIQILESLENIKDDSALFVYHKRIPVYLIPELLEKKLSYRTNEISTNEVHLIIFK